MKRHRNHQIDELAQRFLRDTLPPTWVPNEQHRDYGKDYLVEIGDDNGELTGSSFYLQLKGQETATVSADGSHVKFALESKYATYYSDKIKDLPVFLVVVDVTKKKGWWLFLQPVLEADQTWRKKGSITVSLPASHDITAISSVRNAVEEAKKWMRLHYPESIHESVIAHKQRIIRTDPRFDVNVSLVNDQPKFTLLAKEEVPLTFTFSGDEEVIGKKVSDLIDKGVLVSFQPGELKISGSKLLEPIEQVSCALQASITLTASLTLICRDRDGRELARLSDVPGHVRGGQQELWFDGGLANSPLTLKLGPIAPGVGGSVQLDLSLRRWDGQLLTQLAYFDRLNEFFQALPEAVSTSVECQTDGNTIFSINSAPQSQPFAVPLGGYFKTLWKARKVALRFGIRPTWTLNTCDRDALDTAEQLYAVFFGVGWSEHQPNVKFTASFVRNEINFNVLKMADKPGPVRLTAEFTYTWFGEKIEVGRLVHDYSEMRVDILKNKTLRASKNKKSKKQGKGKSRKVARNDTVEVAFIGSEATILKVQVEGEAPAS